ncbi:MAG: hypothetical protein J1E33_06575 [Alistipes sp.]|nr:hypothetical protein [Alistipes sp.]
MESQKIYLDGGRGSADLTAMVMSALNSRGLDANAIMSQLGNRNGFGNGWGDIIALIIVAAIFGNGNGGIFGNNGNNNGSAEREMILSAINRTGTDVSQLASMLNCSTDQINAAINNVATQICTLAGQQGQSTLQIINAVNSGNASLSATLAQCCCTLQTGMERGFSAVAYETQRQTCDLQNTIKDSSLASTSAIIAKLDQMQTQQLYDKIDSLREKNSTLTTQLNLEHQNAYMAGVVGQAVAPLNAAVAALQNDVNGIKCKLPETATIPYSPVVGVPTCVAAQYGLSAFGLGGFNGFGLGSGFWG